MLPSLSPEPRDSLRGRALEKLTHFLTYPGFGSSPTLVLQCFPVELHAVDVDSELVKRALLNGTGQHGMDDWWRGFMASAAPSATFDGLRSGGEASAQGWLTEIHRDGHVVAGIRADALSQVPAVFAALTEAFADFGVLAMRLHRAAKISGELRLAASLTGCAGLPLLRSADRAPAQKALHRAFYEWPLEAAEGNTAIEAACASMQKRLSRLF